MRNADILSQLRSTVAGTDWKDFATKLVLVLQQALVRQEDVIELTSYTVATLPKVGKYPGLIFVSDEVGGAVPAFSDGTNWRRVTDRAIVS